MNGTELTPSYPDLLRTAYAFGRVDGFLAADVEPIDSAGPSGGCCRGRDAAAFARHLWGVMSGDPPAGLELNAVLWYAGGFEEALAEARADGDDSSRLTGGSMRPSPACGEASPMTAGLRAR